MSSYFLAIPTVNLANQRAGSSQDLDNLDLDHPLVRLLFLFFICNKSVIEKSKSNILLDRPTYNHVHVTVHRFDSLPNENCKEKGAYFFGLFIQAKKA